LNSQSFASHAVDAPDAVVPEQEMDQERMESINERIGSINVDPERSEVNVRYEESQIRQ
jgi:hypothetical protein